MRWNELFRRAAVRLSLGLMLMASQSAQAQQKKVNPAPTSPPPAEAKPNEAPPAWRVQCDGAGQALDCRLSQTLVVQQTGQRLLAVVVRRPSKAEPPALMINLPHGLFLPAGVTLQLDTAKPETLPVQTCDAQGCYAGTTVTTDMLAALQKSQQLSVVVQDLKKQPITVTITMAGFADAYAKLP